MPSILNNLPALGASRTLARNGVDQARSLQRLATGRRINSAGDDAAGLGIFNRLGADIRIQGQARRNANDGISYLNIADGALDEITAALDRGATLAEQAATGTVNAAGRAAMDEEYQRLSATVSEILANTKFNGSKVFASSKPLDVVVSGAGSTVARLATDQLVSGAGSGSDLVIKCTYPGDPLYGEEAYQRMLHLVDVQQAYCGSYVPADAQWRDALDGAASAAMDLLQAHPDSGDAAALAGMTRHLRDFPSDPALGWTFDPLEVAAAAAAASDPIALTLPPRPVSIAVGPFTTVPLDTDPSGIPTDLGSLATPGGARAAKGLLDAALEAVSDLRATVGASTQQLTSLSGALGIQASDLTAAGSRIQDADLADEIIRLTRTQILQQSGTRAMSASGSAQQQILSLLA